jgi:arsenate reductase
LIAKIEQHIASYKAKSTALSSDRQALLDSVAEQLQSALSDKIQLTFICTHNSRRSQIAQVWAHTLAQFYGLTNISVYSGGTETTAFHPNAISALTELGFIVDTPIAENNPHVELQYDEDQPPVVCFSKVYDDPFNPSSDFFAMMTCSDADHNCPVVAGARKRFSLTYDDPKIHDNKENAVHYYIETANLIGMELDYIFRKVIKKN